MNSHSRPAIVSAFAFVCAVSSILFSIPARAQVIYLDEDFEGETIGQPPTNPVQKNAVQVAVAAGTGPFAGTNVADYNDTSSSGGGDLEYNVGASGLSNMYISFDLLNAAPGGTGTAANPIIFGVGDWNNATGTLLGANASRAFGAEFYQTGASSTLRLRVAGTAVYTSTYSMASIQSVEIWVNDDDLNTLAYTRPDGLGAASLAADSFVVYINGTLAGASATGYTMNSAVTAGDSNLGRLGFNSSSTTLTHFTLDNIYVADAIPEPSTAAFLAMAGVSVLLVRRWSVARGG